MVLGALLAAAAAIVLNAAAPHEARVTVSFDPLNRSRTLAELGVPAPAPPTADEVLSNGVLNRMIADHLVPAGERVSTLRDELRLESFQPGQQATLSARDDSDAGAIALANGWATALTRERQDIISGQLDRVRAVLLAQLPALQRSGRLGEQRAVRTQVSLLDASRQALQPEVSISSGAAPVGGSGPRNELLALLLGAAGGALVGLVLELRDARLRTASAAEAAFGAPVLGRLRGPDSIASRLDAMLFVRNGAKASHLVVVTPSASLPDQRDAAVRLGRALAGDQGGVVVVLWRPGGAAGWTVEPEHGVTLVRAGGDHEDVVRGVAGLRGSARMVLVLAPPPRQAPAALLLAQRADAWLVLAELGRTRGEEARQLAEDLEGVPVRPLGVVLAEEAQ